MTRRKQLASDSPRSSPAPARPEWQWWLLAATLPIVCAASRLGVDLWNDEVHNLLAFAAKPWAKIVGDYSAPNNHILFSLVMRPVLLWTGSPFVLRLPSFAFTLGTLVAVYRIARRWSGRTAAMAATLSLGLTQMFLIHTIQVRGYGLLMCLAAWLGDTALSQPQAKGWPRRIAIAALTALLLYTLPTNALVVAPLAVVCMVWAAWKQGRLRAAVEEAQGWTAGILLSALLYLPVFDQLHSAAAGSSRMSMLASLQLGGRVLCHALRDWVPILPLLAMGAVFWIRRIRKEGSPESYLLPLSASAQLLVPFLLAGASGWALFERSFCPILPFLAVVMGWLLAECLSPWEERLAEGNHAALPCAVGMLALAASALPALATYPARLTEYRRTHDAQDGYFDFYAANYHPAAVVEYLKASLDQAEDYQICFADADKNAIWYYLDRIGLPAGRGRAGAGPARVYLIAPERPNYSQIASRFTIPEPLLRALPLIDDFGYYRLYGIAARADRTP